MTIESLGWSPSLQYHLDELGRPDLVAGRVCRVDRGGQTLVCAETEITTRGHTDAVVGDWCALELRADGPAAVRAVLPRRTHLSRLTAGRRSGGQVLAANVDTAFIVTGLDEDFSVRRIERYLVLVWDGGARPALVFTKPDLCPELDARRAEAEAVAGGVASYVVNGLTGAGSADVRAAVGAGETVVLIGSSGVGKSTLINCLLGEERLRTGAVSDRDQRGQHTTTHRELVVMPGGGLLIDTPGLREVGVLASAGSVTQAFPEIEELAAGCRFNDCRHDGEPGCAVEAAAAGGELDAERLASFRSLRHEAEANARRQNEHERRQYERRTEGKYHELGREARRLKGDG